MTSLQNNPKGQAHSRVPECDGQHIVHVKSDRVNRMVTSSGIQTDPSKVVHSSCRLFCHSSESQASTVHVSSPKPTCMGHRCSEHKLVESRSLVISSHGAFSQGDKKIWQCNCHTILIAPGWPEMTYQLPNYCSNSLTFGCLTTTLNI